MPDACEDKYSDWQDLDKNMQDEAKDLTEAIKDDKGALKDLLEHCGDVNIPLCMFDAVDYYNEHKELGEAASEYKDAKDAADQAVDDLWDCLCKNYGSEGEEMEGMEGGGISIDFDFEDMTLIYEEDLGGQSGSEAPSIEEPNIASIPEDIIE